MNRKVALSRRRIIAARREARDQDGQQNYEDSEYWIHLNDFVGVRLGFV